MRVLNTEYNHVCSNDIVFDISYQQFLPVWNPTEEVIDIIFKYQVHYTAASIESMRDILVTEGAKQAVTGLQEKENPELYAERVQQSMAR